MTHGETARFSTTRSCEALGFAFTFESDDAMLVDVVERCYQDLGPASGDHATLSAELSDVGHDRYGVTLTHPDGTVERCGDGRGRGRILELLCWEINRRAVRSVGDLPILHAAVVGGPLGAVALCGASGGGKSTLAAAAAQRGWHHLSDDLGPIDVDAMTVVPYPRPIMLRPGGRALLDAATAPPDEHLPFFTDEWFVRASELGAVIAAEPRPLLAVVILERDDSVSLEPIGRADLLHEMAIHSANLTERGRRGFSDLTKIAEGVPGHRLRLGPLSEALDRIGALIGVGTG